MFGLEKRKKWYQDLPSIHTALLINLWIITIFGGVFIMVMLGFSVYHQFVPCPVQSTDLKILNNLR